MGKTKRLSRRDVLKTGGAMATAAATVSLLSVSKAEAAKNGNPRWAMILDMRKCVGCRGCTVACKSEYNVPLGRWQAVVKEVEFGKYPNVNKVFIPRLCNHCAGEKKDTGQVPPCVEKCPEAKSGKRMKMGDVRYRTGATYKRPDGMILLDNSLCIGCYKCIEACPYGVRSIDPSAKLTRADREKDFGIAKCTFCQHRVDKGVEPSCVNTCQGRARIFGDLNDPNSEVSKLAKKHKLLTLLPEEKTEPQNFYIDYKGGFKKYKIDKKTKEAEFSDGIV